MMAFGGWTCALRRGATVLAIGLLLMEGGAAREAPLVGEDPAIEHHMMELAADLRCLQCQNQTLADSNAPLAVDLRDQIRAMLKRGATDDQVREYLVARYGDFVLYDPPLKGSTLLLWFGPLLLLVGGFAVLYRALLRRRAAPDDPPLSDDDDQRAQQLLAAIHRDPPT
jgi:cytochrome c-type biogenesis protein CcmH